MGLGAAQDLAQRFLVALLGEGDVASLIDWQRFRLLQLIPGTAGADARLRDQLVARGLYEIARAPLVAEAQARAVRSLRSLVEVVLPGGFRLVGGYVNPMVAQLAGGPAEGTPPNLGHYLEQLAEVARAAQAVTIAARDDAEGKKLMTLLFVDGKYVGFLPGSQR